MNTRFLLSGVAALAVAGLASQANAADPMPPMTAATYVAAPVMPAPARTWTGGYIGGHAALVRGTMADGLECFDDDEWVTVYFLVEQEAGEDIDFDGDCDWNSSAGTFNGDQDGLDFADYYLEDEFPPMLTGYLAGAQIGYLRQLGNGPNGFVFGGEVSHSVSSVGALWNSSAFQVLAWNDEFEITALTTATLRAGFAFGPALIYGEYGIALAAAQFTNTFGFSDTDVGFGRVWGVGIEGRVASNISLFFEYNRVKVSNTFLGTGTNVFPPNDQLPTAIGINSTLNVFKTGFNIHFGG